MKHFLKILAITMALVALPALSLAQDTFGSAAIDAGNTYTLTDMLTFAMQDEYLAKAEYDAIQSAFGIDNPFANIMGAEDIHQELLLSLFEAYGIPVPADTANDRVIIPETLQETYEVGVQAEIANIAMYQAFLTQGGLPQDVINAFTALMNASQSHLEAFTRNAERDGIRLNLGEGYQYGQGNSNGNGSMYGEPNQNQETTQIQENTQTQQNQQNSNGNGNGGN